MSKKLLIIIPARSGSTRIKNKNLKKLCGKPLLYYKIKECLKVKSSEVLVSTNCNKIANLLVNVEPKSPFSDLRNMLTQKPQLPQQF